MEGDDARRAIEAVSRFESPRLIAGLARIAGDVSVAGDLAQDALLAALEQWSERLARPVGIAIRLFGAKFAVRGQRTERA